MLYTQLQVLTAMSGVSTDPHMALYHGTVHFFAWPLGMQFVGFTSFLHLKHV